MAKKNEKKKESFWRVFTGADRAKKQEKSANKTIKRAKSAVKSVKNTAKKASNSANSKDSVKTNTKNIGGTQYTVSKTAKSGTLRPASTAKPKTNSTEPGYTAKSGSVLSKSNAQRKYTKGAAQKTIENAVVLNWKKKESQDNIQTKKDANGNTLRTKPDKNQSHTQTMQSNSEAWARLERQKRDYLNNKSTGLFGNKSGEEKEKALENARNSSKVKNIEEKQKKLHEANIKLAKKGDYAYNPDSGEWKYYSGNPVYTSKVLPNQTESEQIEATDQSIGEDGVKPKYSAGERISAGARSIEKKLWNSGYSAFDTAWQAAKNLGQSFMTDGWAKAKSRELALGQQLNIRGLPAERRQEILQAYKEAKASADALSVKTPVDQTLPSQVGMRESRALANMTSQGMSGVPKVATEATLSAAQMAPSIVANIALPGSGLALMAGQAASDKMSTLNQQGISPAESLVRGAISGGIEYGTEKVPLQSITNVFRGTAGRGIRNTLKNVAKSGVENALQEGASYGLNYAADSAAGDPNARFNAAELGKQVAMGGLTGMLMTGAGSAFSRISGVGEPATENNWNRVSKNAELTDNAYAQEKLPNTQNVRTQSAKTQTYEPVTMAQVRAIADNPQEVARLNQQGANIHGTKTEQRAQIQAFWESVLQAQQADMSMRQAEATNAAVPNNTTARPRNERNQALVGNQFETLRDNPSAYSRSANSAEGTPEQNLELLQGIKAKIQNDLQTADSSRAAMLRSSLREINAEISQLQETVKNRRVFGVALYDMPTTQSTRPNDNIAPALAAAGSRLPTNQTVQGVGNAYMNPLVQQYQNNLTGNTAQNAVLNAGGRLSNWDTAPRAQDTPMENPVIASKSRQFENQPIVQENPIQSIQNPTVQRAVRETIPENNPIAETVQNPVSPDSSVGAAKSGFDPYTKAANEYGTIEPGESPSRNVDVPRQMTDDTKVSRFTRTAMEAEATPDELIPLFEKGVANGEFSYNPRKNSSDLKSALSYISQNGFKASLANWNTKMKSGGEVTTDDIIRAQILYQKAANSGDTQTAMQLAAQLAAEGTRLGQQVQAFKLLKRLSPEGRLIYLQRSAQNLSSKYSKRLKGNDITISDSLASEYLNAADDAARQKVEAKIVKQMADQLPPTWADKWNAWRYFAMLGNPRTHIRNVLGNFFMNIPTTAKDITGAALENVFLPKEQRTKSVGTLSKDIRDFAKQDFTEMKSVLQGSAKYNPVETVLRDRDIFSNNNIFGKTMNKLNKWNSDALEAEDAFSLGIRYRSALGHYMKARGLTSADMTGDVLERARTYAIDEAQRATFRDDSKLATKLQDVENTNTATKIAIGGLVPFKKTPLNIVKRGVEYSPAGFLKAGSDAIQIVQQNRGKLEHGTMTGAQLIDDLSKAIVGTGLMGAGFALAKANLLNGADADEKKLQYLNDESGVQSYSVNVLGHSYTVDWTAPSSLPVFMGVELYNTLQNEPDDVLNGVISSLENITEPIFNLTMLDGIQSTIQGISYGSGSMMSTGIREIIQSYLGQAVPTLFGQFARTMDNTRRSSSTPDKITGVDSVDKFLRRQQAKIPWVSSHGIPGTPVTGLQPYLDVFGNESKTNNIVARALQNFISPGYIAKRKDDADVEGHLRNLFSATGDSSVLPGKAGAFKIDGNEVKLNGVEQTAYTKNAGQSSYKALQSLFQTDIYKEMSNEDKVRAVNDVYSYARDIAKSGTNKGYNMSSTSKLAQQAAADGAPIGSYFALKALQAAQAAKLKDEGAEGAESLARRAMLNAVQNDTSLSDDQKNALYKNLVIPAYGSTTKGVNSASKEYEELSNYISPAVYAALKDKKNEIDTDPKYVNADGSNVKGSDGLKQGDWEKYLANAGLTPAARAAVQDKVKFWQRIPATAKATNFSDAATYGMGSKTAQKYAAQAAQAGLSWDTYQDVAQYKNSLKGTGDGQKDKVISYINKITSDPAQRAVLRKLMNYK